MAAIAQAVEISPVTAPQAHEAAGAQRAPRWWRALESGLDRVAGARDNPLRNLGALGFFFFWIVTVTGVYLYAAFDTSVAGAWQSVEHLTRGQWYLGGLMRSLHRYASAAFSLVMLLHLAKETLGRHFGSFRTFSWLTGVPLIWLTYAAGIGGYWLVWDRLAQFSAIATLEWLDALGVFAEPLARNFISPDAVNDRLFSLLVFLHIGIPLLLLLGMWVHIQRLSRPAVLPSRRLAAFTFAALAAASLLRPALSAAPADLATVPDRVGLDWFYMFVHPLMYETSAAIAWAIAAGVTLALAAAPLFALRRRLPAAVVDPHNCNGCGQCVADCPFAAISLVTHTLEGRHKIQALVDPDRCASCGICVGACPSATPFRSVGRLASGIELPQLSVESLRDRVGAALAAGPAQKRFIVFGCDSGADVSLLSADDVATFSLPCAGMLPPSFAAWALRGGAQGVLVGTCGEGDCAWRLGEQWIVERLDGTREPGLRPSARSRVRNVPAGPGEQARLREGLARLRHAVTAAPAATFGETA
jgi:ferredoxin/coenzyme F420-reducing hydrogenase delta subunit